MSLGFVPVLLNLSRVAKKARVLNVAVQPLQTLWECYQLKFSAVELQQVSPNSLLYLG